VDAEIARRIAAADSGARVDELRRRAGRAETRAAIAAELAAARALDLLRETAAGSPPTAEAAAGGGAEAAAPDGESQPGAAEEGSAR
jgi:hypothetical protein